MLANAYIDLGTWWCLTPFVGAGVGAAYHKFTGLTDVGHIADGSTGFGYASTDSSKWNMAWALHAGVAYNVTNNFKVELAYRYVNFGSIETPVIDCAFVGLRRPPARVPPTPSPTTTRRTSRSACAGCCSRNRSTFRRRSSARVDRQANRGEIERRGTCPAPLSFVPSVRRTRASAKSAGAEKIQIRVFGNEGGPAN